LCILKQNEKKGLLACAEPELKKILPNKSALNVPTTKYMRFIDQVFRENPALATI
jgi:hypothetical protein